VPLIVRGNDSGGAVPCRHNHGHPRRISQLLSVGAIDSGIIVTAP